MPKFGDLCLTLYNEKRRTQPRKTELVTKPQKHDWHSEVMCNFATGICFRN